MAAKTASRTVHQLKVSLKRIDPPIWRRIQVPSDTTLRRLHWYLQVAMGWTNSHLYLFYAKDGC